MKTIYETPDAWGETLYFDITAADELLASLAELGEDWDQVQLGDCDEWTQEETSIYYHYCPGSNDGRSGRYEYVVLTPDPANAGYYLRRKAKDLYGSPIPATFDTVEEARNAV